MEGPRTLNERIDDLEKQEKSTRLIFGLSIIVVSIVLVIMIWFGVSSTQPYF